MLHDPTPDAQHALDLVRRGRFTETAHFLNQPSRNSPHKTRKNQLCQALLADVLQRIGQNQSAEAIATEHLRQKAEAPTLQSRFHLVLGNVFRERGDLNKAIEHFQIAISLAGSDHEIASWAQLRLITSIGDLNGREAALARLEAVNRTLTKYGEARPFAALHLWFVEIDSVRGNIEGARRHLATAASLLNNIDDVWLRGYLSINSAVVHYYRAEIDEARSSAEAAIKYADESGHRGTKRAAHANLGYFEFAVAEFAKAEAHFQLALECCERGSANEIVILDNIAETKLERGDLSGCKLALEQLETLMNRSIDDNRRHYHAWALQTRVRLMLREGHKDKARTLINKITSLIAGLPQGRVTVESRLLSVEALLDEDPIAAAINLTPLFRPAVRLAPDLFAETELVAGKLLAACGPPNLAKIHIDRAAQTYDTVGHLVGRRRSRAALECLQYSNSRLDELGPERTLDRIRTLLELRTRAELFGREAAALLRELRCACCIHLVVDSKSGGRVVHEILDSGDNPPSHQEVSIAIGNDRDITVTLSFQPIAQPQSILTSLAFRRVIEQLLITETHESFSDEKEIIWAYAEGNSPSRGIVFASDAILGVWRVLRKIAPTDVSVLVTGETGTGKEVIARAIHDYSDRAAMPFLALNCAAVPKELLESQLFGHRKGAFSGAAEHHQGIVRAANGGTLFLDEIGEMPLDMQAKLLRFLEMSEVHPVGETQPVKVNVRLVFATNGDLEEAVSQNRFRQDLFYRLNVIPIKVPPLRERREEIPVLAHLFAQRFAAEFKKEPLQFSSSAMELLIMYAWPGNIRQLANEVRRLTALTESGTCVTPEDLSPHLQANKPRTTGDDTTLLRISVEQPLDKATAHLESEMIKHALRQARGHLSVAASTLGISRKGLYLKRLRLGLLDAHQRQH